MFAACGYDSNEAIPEDVSAGRDAGSEGAPTDSSAQGGADDAFVDSGDADVAVDAGGALQDAGPKDAGVDAGSHDAAVDAAVEQDAGPTDAGPPDPAPCTRRKYYRDDDADGFGVIASFIEACDPRDSYTALVAGDCYDANANVKLGQTAYFSAERGDGSFDYNCDGAASKRYTQFAVCPDFEDSCPPPNYWPAGFSCDYLGIITPPATEARESGWDTVSIPNCGELGAFGYGLRWNVGNSSYYCGPSLQQTTRRQACR